MSQDAVKDIVKGLYCVGSSRLGSHKKVVLKPSCSMIEIDKL